MAVATIGKIVKEWGVKGEVKVIPLDFPLESLVGLKEVFLLSAKGPSEDQSEDQNEDQNEEWKIAGVKLLTDGAAIKFEGLDSKEEAVRLRNRLVGIEQGELPPLPEGVYHFHEVIGLKVVTSAGSEIGVVEDIMKIPSNDVYVVRKEDKEYLIPAVADVVKEINPASGYLLIEPLEGLLD